MPKDRYAIVPAEDRRNFGSSRKPVALPEDRPLTAKQQRFVDELVANDGQVTLREAAIRAGYGQKNAHAVAYVLTNPMRSPHVVAALKRARDEQDRKYAVDYKRHLRDLQRIRDAALNAGAYGAAVQAEYRRGMAHGHIYVHKSEVRHGSIDTMSKEEVLRALQELESKGRGLIDVTPPARAASDGGEDDSEGEGVEDLGEDSASPEEGGLGVDPGRDMGHPRVP